MTDRRELLFAYSCFVCRISCFGLCLWYEPFFVTTTIWRCSSRASWTFDAHLVSTCAVFGLLFSLARICILELCCGPRKSAVRVIAHSCRTQYERLAGFVTSIQVTKSVPLMPIRCPLWEQKPASWASCWVPSEITQLNHNAYILPISRNKPILHQAKRPINPIHLSRILVSTCTGSFIDQPAQVLFGLFFQALALALSHSELCCLHWVNYAEINYCGFPILPFSRNHLYWPLNSKSVNRRRWGMNMREQQRGIRGAMRPEKTAEGWKKWERRTTEIERGSSRLYRKIRRAWDRNQKPVFDFAKEI